MIKFFYLTCIICILQLFVSCKSICFTEKHHIDNIIKAEVSGWHKNEHKEIDSTEFIDIVNTAKKVTSKFIPYKTVTLYGNNGTIYEFVFSNSYGTFHMNGGGYKLSKKYAKQMSELLNP